MIVINGEQISNEEAEYLLRMLYSDAKQIAGMFHGMNRSPKFRVNWPDEYKFVNSEWKTFVEAARGMYADRLNDPKTPEADARKMHLAIVLQDMIGKDQEKDNRLQLAPNTQQFEGDNRENKNVIEKFGLTPNLRAALLNSTTTRH